MEQIISKELLGEVLEIKDLDSDKVIYLLKDWNQIVYTKKHEEFSINIYELENKCLRWAWDKGYSFDVIPFCVNVTSLETGETEVFRYEKEDMLNKVPFLSKYVFKACEWILNNIKDSN